MPSDNMQISILNLANANNSSQIEEIDEADQKIAELLRDLSQWLDDNPRINAEKTVDNLLFFLQNCKFNLEKTKKKLTIYYKMRAERTEWFTNRNPFLPEIQDLLKIGPFIPIDGVDEQNRKVVVIRTAAHDPKLHTQNNVFKVGKMILDLMMKLEPLNCVNGIVAIFDMKGIRAGHAVQISNRSLVKNAVESWHSYPCQPKRLEFVNANASLNVVLNIFRFFMTPKMKARIFVERRCTIKNANLPQELGGTTTSYRELAAKWRNLVEQNANFYIENDKFKSILT